MDQSFQLVMSLRGSPRLHQTTQVGGFRILLSRTEGTVWHWRNEIQVRETQLKKKLHLYLHPVAFRKLSSLKAAECQRVLFSLVPLPQSNYSLSPNIKIHIFTPLY